MSKTSTHTGALYARISGQHYAMDYTGADVLRLKERHTFHEELIKRQTAKIEEQRTHINALESLTVALQETNKEQTNTIHVLRTEAITTQATITEQQETINQLRNDVDSLTGKEETSFEIIKEERNKIATRDETIKGLDRANQRYKEIIEQYRKEMLQLQARLHECEQGHVKRDGLIEQLHDRIMDGETVIDLHQRQIEEMKKGGE